MATLAKLAEDSNSNNSALALFHMGNLYMQDADWEEADNCFRQAAELMPRWPEPTFNLGIVLQAMSRFAEAVKTLDKAEELFKAAGAKETRDSGLLGRLRMYRGLSALSIQGDFDATTRGLSDLGRAIDLLSGQLRSRMSLDLLDEAGERIQKTVERIRDQLLLIPPPGPTGPPGTTTTAPGY